jgi:hypothetical protein
MRPIFRRRRHSSSQLAVSPELRTTREELEEAKRKIENLKTRQERVEGALIALLGPGGASDAKTILAGPPLRARF